jgi:proteasome accessory factor C
MTSDRTAMRLSRILSVLPFIIEHDGATVDELVERFDYRDKADLIKDLHLVFVTGLPGYGPGDLIDVDIYDDEVFIDAADYFSRPLRLTPPEALGLLAAGMTLVESQQAPPALRTAVDKLVDVVGKDVADAVHFDIPTPDTVEHLRSAIDEGRVVRIGYVGMATNERTVREVEGWTVTFSLGNWYFTGHCRLAGDRRVFRVDRIDALDVLDERYEVPGGRAAGPITYQPGESDTQVEFTVSPRAAWVAEYYPVDSDTTAEGGTRIRMSVADPAVAARLILQLGSDVSAISGTEVSNAVDDLRQRILARYRRTK